MKLGIMLAGKRPEDITAKLDHAREAGYSLCQLNLLQTGITRAEMVQIADALVDRGMRAVAIGCYVNPLRPDDPSCMGTTRADLDIVLHALDIIGARKVVFYSGTLASHAFETHDDNATAENEAILAQFLSDVIATTRARHYFLCIELFHGHVLCDEKRALAFHNSLPDAVAERVRFVLDASNFITEDRYRNRDQEAANILSALGSLAGIAHLKDCIMPPDGDAGMPGPGKGMLNYPSYLTALKAHSAPDTPAVIRNVPPTEYADVRDFILRSADHWELA